MPRTRSTDAATDPIPRTRRTADAYARLAGRLTPRDRWILRMLHEHRVFTTPQLADLAFGSPITASHRLLTLQRLGVVTRWRPWTGARSAPWHWALDVMGAEVVASEKGCTLADLGYRRDLAEAIFGSAKLAHQLGVNTLFAALARATRHHPPSDVADQYGLTEWWPEARCAKTWGRIVQPDAYGQWTTHRHTVCFFLEHDTGTETIARVAAKLARYADLAEATGITTPVLFHFPSLRREANFRAARIPLPHVPVHTTNTPLLTAQGLNPAEAVWTPLDTTQANCGGANTCRLRLTDLAPAASEPSQQANLPRTRAEQPAHSAWSTRPVGIPHQ